ncbi:MAG: GFA family protein, partial [Pseudomonadota bacterium]
MADPVMNSAEGGCLCGGVRYRIEGPLRDIINCHCENCRRTHGHVAAYTSVDQSDLIFIHQETLRWYFDESPKTRRGFCRGCGASLFWDACNGNNRMGVAAGSLDDSGCLKTIGHVYVAEAGKYYSATFFL